MIGLYGDGYSDLDHLKEALEHDMDLSEDWETCAEAMVSDMNVDDDTLEEFAHLAIQLGTVDDFEPNEEI